jgi:protein gp37
MQNTSIAWTNHTFNPWWGCTPVSSGCDHCYAWAWDIRVGGDHWGKDQPRREFGDKHWADPLKWNLAAKSEGVRHKVFCASMADVMDDEAPPGARERLWGLIDQTSHLIWQLLTKRPHRYERYLPAAFTHDNVWLGISTENQHYYNVRWPILRAACERYHCISFVSYEPALGPLSMLGFPSFPNWVICGGESGPHRRPMEQQWAENLLAECNCHGRPEFFMKQMSASTPEKGAELIPVHLLVRNFPDGGSTAR